MSRRPQPPRPAATPAVHPQLPHAVSLHQAGRLDEAGAIYARIIADEPRNFDALHLLGVVALQQGDFSRAMQMIAAALKINPNDAAALGNMGTAYLRAGDLDSALKQFERAARFQPQSAVALTNLAGVLRQLGRSNDALAHLRRANIANPGSIVILNLMGACLLDIGDPHAAATSFQRATEIAPGDADSWANLAAALNRTGDLAGAEDIVGRAVAMQPDSSASLAVLAAIQLEKGELSAAIATFRESVALPGPSTQTLCAFGNALIRAGLADEAIQTLEQSLALDGDNVMARWALAMAQLRAIYDDAAQMDRSRVALAAHFDDLQRWFKARHRPDAYLAVGSNQPFFLPYQPYDNRELLMQYGRICAEWIRLAPVEKAGPAARRPTAGRKPRLGIVSSQIRDHSVWLAITRGWVKHLDLNRFDLCVFHLSPITDGETQFARDRAVLFEERPRSLPDWVRAIRAAQLDIIIYPETVMDALTTQLASMRLAPLQATTWGHPETSGLPTMDLFFSAELMEPPGAAVHYSERLVSLPNLGVSVEALAPDIQAPDLRQLGLPRDEPLLLCPGSPFKYTPQSDHVWARIARGLHDAGGGWLVFFRSRSETMDAMLERRLRRAFDREGVDFDAHACIVPTLQRGYFYGLMRASTLLLDTPGFSGFNTAIQGIEADLPVLAHEGRFMRGRLASAIMRRMGIDELVAGTDDAFIGSALRLAADPQACEALRSRIRQQRHLLFDDVTPVRALEEVLLEAMNRSRTSWD